MFTRPVFAVLSLCWFATQLHAAPAPVEQRKPGDVVEFEIAKGVKMKFCWVPAGKVQLGSPKAEQEYVTKTFHNGKRFDFFDLETETARGEFTTKGFWLGKYAVTQEEWEAVMGSNPSCFSRQGNGKNKVLGMDTSRFPVEQVSWSDCQEFLKKLNEKATVQAALGKNKIALPHDDEWEYACRGGKGNKRPFYFGDELDGTQANSNGDIPYGTTTKGTFLARTSEVGSYENVAPHPWGLCDMHGNVWQWCSNTYSKRNSRRVVRGGSFNYASNGCRSAFRGYNTPDYRGFSIGLRVAVSP